MGLLFEDAGWPPLLAGRHRGIHNFSYGALATYFYLESAASEWLDGCVLRVERGGRHKAWVFDSPTPPDRRLLDSLRRRGPVYSQIDLGLDGGSTFREVAYNLPEVFDPGSYPNKKKRHQRLYYPASWLARRGVTLSPLDADDLQEVGDLHDRWVAHKLAQPHTYQIMFPRRRYYECCAAAARQRRHLLRVHAGERLPATPLAGSPEGSENFASRALSRGFSPLGEYFGCVARVEGRISGVRVVYAESDVAFDLASFCDPDAPSNFSEHFAHAAMREMARRGVQTLNCGASLNRHLASFKHHWPHRPVSHWAYSKLS